MNATTERKEIFIPFAGFYESVHDHELDREVEQMADSEGVDWETFHDAIDYRVVHTAYAKEYASNVAAYIEQETRDPRDPELVIKLDLEFEALISPREYNFGTDRIKCTIDLDSIRCLWNNANAGTLSQVASERHSSRSGFHSFYDPDWRTWGPVEEWDANQLETLLISVLREALAMDDENELDDRIIEFDHEMASSAFSVSGAIDEGAIRAAKGE